MSNSPNDKIRRLEEENKALRTQLRSREKTSKTSIVSSIPLIGRIIDIQMNQFSMIRTSMESVGSALAVQSLTGISAFDVFTAWNLSFILTCAIYKLSLRHVSTNKSIRKILLIGVFMYLFYPALMNITFMRIQFTNVADLSQQVAKNVVRNGIQDMKACIENVYNDILKYAPPTEKAKTILSSVLGFTETITKRVYDYMNDNKEESFDFSSIDDTRYMQIVSTLVANTDMKLDSSVTSFVSYTLGAGSDAIVQFLQNPAMLVDSERLSSAKLMERVIPFIETNTGIKVEGYNRDAIIKNLDIFRLSFIKTLEKESAIFKEHMKFITKKHTQYIKNQSIHPINTLVNTALQVPTQYMLDRASGRYTDKFAVVEYDELIEHEIEEVGEHNFFNNYDTSILFFLCILILFGSLRGIYRSFRRPRTSSKQLQSGGGAEKYDEFVDQFMQMYFKKSTPKSTSIKRKSKKSKHI